MSQWRSDLPFNGGINWVLSHTHPTRIYNLISQSSIEHIHIFGRWNTIHNINKITWYIVVLIWPLKDQFRRRTHIYMKTELFTCSARFSNQYWRKKNVFLTQNDCFALVCSLRKMWLILITCSISWLRKWDLKFSS